LVVRAGIGIVEIVSIRVEVAAARKRCVGEHGKRIAALDDTGAADAPAPGSPAHEALAAIQARQFVVGGQREAMRRIPRRVIVKLTRIERRWIYAGVISRYRASVRRVEERATETATHIERHTVVIAVPVILCIADRSEAWIQSSRSRPWWLADQVTRQRIDILAVVHLAGLVPSGNQVRRMRSAVQNAGDQVTAQAVFQRRRPCIG